MIDYWQILPHLFLLKRLVFKIFVGFSGATNIGILRQNIVNDVAMHIGQSSLNTIVIESKLFVIDAQNMENSRMEIMPCNWVGCYLPANRV